MKAESYNIPLTFTQILELVKQLPKSKKIKLTKELEKDAIGSKLSALLRIFKTNDLSIDTINDEVETVRQQLYDKSKNIKVIFDTNIWISFLISKKALITGDKDLLELNPFSFMSAKILSPAEFEREVL